ncbi:VOC family protein [Paenarthrobacter sp. NPDC058040]|uniref:VOC family protein n=1 Tax=unclassified Paenarthrobacter TaxID=2634190 RepID=UPI0036DF5886
MAVSFNHTIVYATDKHRSAAFLAHIFGLPSPQPMWSFVTVALENGVTLDFLGAEGKVVPQHYAFLVSEKEFDQIFLRITAEHVDYWADPSRTRAHQINHNDGGRGIYFQDPDGHLLEAITRPYGSG